jgi:hypothetical protein
MKVRHVHDHQRKHPKSHNSPRRFTVSLTEGEVDFLIGVTASIGGDLKGSPRKYAQRIYDALTDAAGYQARDTDSYRHLRGMLWFSEYAKGVPSYMRATYNHARDTVTTLGLLGEETTGVTSEVMHAMASVGDDIAAELHLQGETLDALPIPHFTREPNRYDAVRELFTRLGAISS